MRIGFLGPAGTFSEEALKIWLETKGSKETAVEKIAYPTIKSLLLAVGKEIDFAVVPIENSLEGSVNITIDTLIQGIEAQIYDEIILPIIHHLFAAKALPLTKIKAVYSHPQALHQCQNYLQKMLPGISLKETTSTAQAADILLEGKSNIAAIGGRSLIKNRPLTILACNIQDNDKNMTRFYILAKEKRKITGKDKTTLIFTTENKPGSLFECLQVFARAGINLTKIESRPSKRILGEYVFFVEMEGHQSSEPLKTVLGKLKPLTGYYKIIGSYPVFSCP